MSLMVLARLRWSSEARAGEPQSERCSYVLTRTARPDEHALSA